MESNGINMLQGQRPKKYTHLSSYENVLTRPFVESKFYQSVNPSTAIDRNNTCKINNGCQSNVTYTYINKRGPEPSPYFKQDTNGAQMSTKADARLFNSAHNQYTQLDSTPIQVVYDLINDNISNNPKLKDYGKNYTDYKSVTGGQIQYYVDREFSEPFYSPIYGTRAKSTGTMYKDPMDSVKPHFDREYPEFAMYRDGTCLSYVDDTTKFRDDIISRQQRVNNQKDFSLLYGKV
jgi:hypothetical protein